MLNNWIWFWILLILIDWFTDSVCIVWNVDRTSILFKWISPFFSIIILFPILITCWGEYVKSLPINIGFCPKNVEAVWYSSWLFISKSLNILLPIDIIFLAKDFWNDLLPIIIASCNPLSNNSSWELPISFPITIELFPKVLKSFPIQMLSIPDDLMYDPNRTFCPSMLSRALDMVRFLISIDTE